MHVGICLSGIDHDRQSRGQAREEVLRLQERYKFTSVELVFEGIGRRYAPYPWEWAESEIREVEEFLKSFERSGTHLPFYAMNVIAVNERVRDDAMEQMTQAIEVATRLNLDYAVIHATGTTEGLQTAREPERQAKAFTRLATLCKGSNTTLSIENAHNLHELDACTTMIRGLKSEGLPVAMTFDTGHSNIPATAFAELAKTPGLRNVPPNQHYGSVANAMADCIDILNNVHLHNNDGSYDQHRGLLEGSMDLKAAIQRLRDLDYQGSISIEVRPQTRELAEEIATLQEWIG